MPPVVLAYDNMCNLDQLRVTKKLLPLPPPMGKLWSNVTKVIDRFHLRNHTRPTCHVNYNPDHIQAKYPDLKLKTQAGEQTFVWAARFKRTVSCDE